MQNDVKTGLEEEKAEDPSATGETNKLIDAVTKKLESQVEEGKLELKDDPKPESSPEKTPVERDENTVASNAENKIEEAGVEAEAKEEETNPETEKKPEVEEVADDLGAKVE